MRILLIDDHMLFRKGLQFLLADMDSDVEFMEASGCNSAFQSFPNDHMDLVMLDFYMPGIGGFTALDAVKKHYQRASVVVLSSEDSPEIIHTAIENGAAGFIPKSSSPEVLISAIKLIMAGGVYLPEASIQAMSKIENQHKMVGRNGESDNSLERLTKRQYEVLMLAVQGKSNKVIASEMFITERTVKAHLSAAYQVLGVHNRTEAVFIVAKSGYLPDKFSLSN